MILYFLITALIYAVSIVFAVFPTVEELPWGVDSALSDGVAYYRLIAETIPILTLMMNLTLIWIGFKLSLIVLKFFLGSRTPNHG